VEGISLDVLRSDAAQLKADEIALVRQRLAASATGNLRRASEAVLKAGTKRMEDDAYNGFMGAVTGAVRLKATDDGLRKLERGYRSHVITDGRPVDPYGKGGYSWAADHLANAGNSAHRGVPGFQQRLEQHGRRVAEALDKRTKWGRQIEAQIRAQYDRPVDERSQSRIDQRVQADIRALTTGGGATASAGGGGTAAFVVPQFIEEQFAIWRSPYRVICDQLNDEVALGPYGLEAYVPQVTAATSVTATSEGNAVSLGTPTAGYVSATVSQYSGGVELSQALVDRAGPGIMADVYVARQLKDQYGAQESIACIAAMTAGANTVTNNGSFKVVATSGVSGSMLDDIRKAKNATANGAGTAIRSTHLFCVSSIANFIEAYGDAEGRPVFSPAALPTPVPTQEGFTGYRLSGLAVYTDDNVPTLTTANLEQVIVTNPSYTLLMESAPIVQLTPQFGAGNLQPIITLRGYFACLPRYPNAVSVISGAAYASSVFA
jgi:HK97 family phage major capsid protein